MYNRFLIFLVVILVLLPFGVQAGFGVSPPLVFEDKLVPGITIEREIYLIQGNPQHPVTVEAKVDAPEIKDWISVDKGDKFEIPAGIQQYPIKIKIQVPEGTPLGIYKGSLRITTVPNKGTEDGQVVIALGAKIEIDLTVGDDVFSEYEVRSVEIETIKERDPAHIKVRINNTGNVPAAPEAVSFELFNKFGDVRLAYADTKNFGKVKAFSEETIDLYFPLDVIIGPGEYWGHVKVYDQGIIDEERTVFEVLPKTFWEKNAVYVYSVIGGLVFLILLVVVLLKFRRR